MSRNIVLNFSAADLVKRSATQIAYLSIVGNNNTISERAVRGDKYAKSVSKKRGGCEEKRGVISFCNNNIYFCIDLFVKPNKFVEIKMVEDQNNYPEWYLQSSILQSTLYATLLEDVKHLDTPTFRIKEGYPNEKINLPSRKIFELWFGNDRYLIKPNKEISSFYKNKSLIISNCIKSGKLNNLDECRDFDKKFKHKEYYLFKPYSKLLKNDIYK